MTISRNQRTDIPERLQELISSSSGPSEPVVEREPTTADHFEAFLAGMGFTDGDVRRGMLTKQIADIIRTQDGHETWSRSNHTAAPGPGPTSRTPPSKPHRP
ncbi:hypothetical protein [Streptomyces sp. NPDC001083]|uniref:hypothetical protein n=1 Tax=Streptomyces sp. NPDC001083 TaxID=3364545 RepID=UPI0036ADB8EF